MGIDSKKLSKYTFFLLLFLLPFQMVLLLREPIIAGEKWQYGTIGLYGTDILLILSVILAFLSFVIPAKAGIQEDRRLGPRIKSGMTTLSLIVFLFWSGLSILWASDQMLAGYFFIKLLLGVGVFLLARSLSESDVKVVVKVLLAVAVIQSVIGIGQFLSQETVSSSLLGMSAHESWQAGTSVLKLDEGRFLRAYGSFPHPNILGGFLSVVLVVGIGYRVFQTMVQDAGCRIQGYDASLIRPHLSYIIYHASLILILLALILTFSRSAWLGVAIGIVAYYVFCILYPSHQTKSKCIIIPRPWNYDTFFKMMFALGIATVVFVFVLRDRVFPRFDVATIVGEGSVSERMVSLEDARALIVANSIAGVGAGNFTAAIMENEPTRPVWSVQPAHNVFALVWAELGAVGGSLFLLFLFSAIASVAKQSRNQEKSLYCHGGGTPPRNDREGDLILKNQNVIFATAFLTLIPSLFLDHWLWSSHFGILFFFLLAGFAARKN